MQNRLPHSGKYSIMRGVGMMPLFCSIRKPFRLCYTVREQKGSNMGRSEIREHIFRILFGKEFHTPEELPEQKMRHISRKKARKSKR